MEGIPFASNGEVTSAEVVGGNPDSPTDGAGVDVALGTTKLRKGWELRGTCSVPQSLMRGWCSKGSLVMPSPWRIWRLVSQIPLSTEILQGEYRVTG